jgi:Uma2 family endonuclease
MATAIETPPVRQADDRFVLRHLDWAAYDAIRRALGNHPTRLTYDGKNLEFMSPSSLHESYSSLFGRILGALALDRDIEMRGGRSTTFRREDVQRGLEPDDCYWIQNERAVRGKPEIDLSFDPPPDLAIEIDISRSSLDRLAIYSKLRVPEVWQFDGESLRIHQLQPDGAYAVSETSRCLPFLDIQILVPVLQLESDVGETTRIREFLRAIRR